MVATAHFAASLLCLQPALVQRSNPKRAKWPAQLGRTTCVPGYYTFDSGTCAIRKTLTVASKTSKTIPALSNLKQMPLAMKFQISNEKSQIFPYTTQSCNALGKLVATYKVAASLFCAAQSLFRSILECCGDSGSNTPNDQPDWNLNFKKRLGWLPRQARPSLHGGRRPTWNKCHWTWKFKSTMRIPELPQHKPGSPWENWWLPTTSQLHFFALHSLYLRPFYTMAAGSCPKIAILVQPPLLQRYWPKSAKYRVQLGRTIFEPCHFNFTAW